MCDAGKTMENVRCRMDMRLCQDAERIMTYTSRPLCKSVKAFGPELVGVQLLKEKVSYNALLCMTSQFWKDLSIF